MIAGDDEPRRLRRGDFFGEVSTLLECKPTADVVARSRSALPGDPGPAARDVPPAVPAGHLPDAPDRHAPDPRRPPIAGRRRLTTSGRFRRATTPSSSSEAVRAACRRATASRGSASSTPSSRATTRRAACSASFRSSSGSFRGRSPTRPPSPARARTSGTTTTASSRTSPSIRRSCRRAWTATYMVPSRRGDGARARRLRRAGARSRALRLHLGVDAARRRRSPRARRPPTASTARARVVFALGVTTPWLSPIPGIETVPHYVDTRRPADYRGRSVFVIGKRNSAFEIADGLLPWARRVILGSPRPVQTSVIAQASVRVRYLQPYEDAALGGGTFALDLVRRPHREARARLAHPRQRHDEAGLGRPGGRRRHRGDRLLDAAARPRRASACARSLRAAFRP